MTEAGEPAPAESHHAFTPSQLPSHTLAAATADLPEFAKEADDLEAIKKAVDDAASVGGGLWLSYLFVLFYLAVAAGAVTHTDLFLENSVKLPFLNVELPLLAFFFLAPILLLFVHAYTLVHLVMLSDKAKRFHQALHEQIGDDDRAKQGPVGRATIRAGLQRQLPSNIFVQFLAGPPDIRASLFGSLLRGIAWSTLVVAPVLLLLLMQMQFLPFHSPFITWTHRLAILADLGLVWWLWREVLSGRAADGRRRPTSRPWTGVGLALSGCAVFFSWAVASFPGEWQTEHLAVWRPIHERDRDRNPVMVSVHDWLFNSVIDDTSRRRRFPFSSTLVLTGLNIYEELKIDDPDKMKGRDYVFRARGRDLRGAIFDLATLPKVDFDGADLREASLYGALLQGTRLVSAQLQGARLVEARLRGASLRGAQLQGSLLDDAQLQGAALNCAALRGGKLVCTQLQGASLVRAQLQGALLYGAQLQGAGLARAQLQGSWLEGAWLQGAELNDAQLQGAELKNAQLQGASLQRAQLQGASFVGVQLQGASLLGAVLRATDLSDALLWRTDRAALPNGDGAEVAAVRISDAADKWAPSQRDDRREIHSWDNKTYQGLQEMMESLPPGDLRDYASYRISRLDCANADPSLSSCDPSLPPPSEAVAWRKSLEDAGVDDTAYANALATELRTLVCSGGDDAIYVVRGHGFQSRLNAAGLADINLIGDLTNKDSKDCPVSAALTDADRSRLLQIKQDIEKSGK